MIFKKDILNWVTGPLSEYKIKSPETYRFISESIRFNKFIDLLHERINEIELYLINTGINPTAKQLEQFTINALLTYIEMQINLIEEKTIKDTKTILEERKKARRKQRKELKLYGCLMKPSFQK